MKSCRETVKPKKRPASAYNGKMTVRDLYKNLCKKSKVPLNIGMLER